MLGVIIANELGEGPSPRWIGVVADGLREQARPHGVSIQAFAVLGGDFEQRRATNDDGQKARAGDGHQQPSRIQDEPLFAMSQFGVGDDR